MRTLIIIPAYNEEESISTVVDNLINEYPQFDYVVINDGSKDNTAAICRRKGYNFVNQPINLGLAGAFQTGMKYAYAHQYDAAIQFDADGQHLPEYIQGMVNQLEQGCDIVIASRFLKQRKPFTMRMVGSHLISFAIRLTTGRKICDPTSGMRLYGARMIKELATQINLGPEPDTIAHLIRRGALVREVQVEMRERIAGNSYLTLFRSVSYMLQMAVSILLVQWFRSGKRFEPEEGSGESVN